MKLEAGKYYRDRTGHVHGPLKDYGSGPLLFQCMMCTGVWAEDGRNSEESGEDEDLIEEVLIMPTSVDLGSQDKTAIEAGPALQDVVADFIEACKPPSAAVQRAAEYRRVWLEVAMRWHVALGEYAKAEWREMEKIAFEKADAFLDELKGRDGGACS